MNKQDLIAEVRARLDVSWRTATESVDAVFASVARAVAAGEKVSVPGFGTFDVQVRAPRSARNPRTGERVAVPASRAAVFRPAAALKQAVAGTARSRTKTGPRKR